MRFDWQSKRVDRTGHLAASAPGRDVGSATWPFAERLRITLSFSSLLLLLPSHQVLFSSFFSGLLCGSFVSASFFSVDYEHSSSTSVYRFVVSSNLTPTKPFTFTRDCSQCCTPMRRWRQRSSAVSLTGAIKWGASSRRSASTELRKSLRRLTDHFHSDVTTRRIHGRK